MKQNKKLPLTAVWRNGVFSASYDSFEGKQTLVLRINICGENPPLRQAAKRYASLKKDQTKTIPSLTIVKNAHASQNDKYKKPTYEN